MFDWLFGWLNRKPAEVTSYPANIGDVQQEDFGQAINVIDLFGENGKIAGMEPGISKTYKLLEMPNRAQSEELRRVLGGNYYTTRWSNYTITIMKPKA